MVTIIGCLAGLFFQRPAPDTGRYQLQANNLYQKGIYSVNGTKTEARDAPGLPIIFYLALLKKVSPLKTVAIINGLCLGIIAGICGWMTAKISKQKLDSFFPLLGVLGAGLFPTLLGSCLFALTETIYTALFLVGNAFLFSCLQEQRNFMALRWGLAGLAFGIAALFRPVNLLYPLGALPILILLIMLQQKNRKTPQVKLKTLSLRASLSLFMFVLVIAPWTLRNYFIYKEFIPIRIEMGGPLYIGTRQDWKGEFQPDTHLQSELMKSEGITLLEADRKLRKLAIKAIKDNPVAWLKLIPHKLNLFWLGVPGSKRQIKQKAVIKIIKVITILTLLLASLGLGLHFKNSYIIFLLLPVIYTCAVHVVLFAMPRFRLPVDPYLIIFAVLALEKLFNAKEARKAS